MEHQFTLEPYKNKSTKHDCPGCGEKKTFTRYINTDTFEHLSPIVGRCDRESNCGYHYKPKDFFTDNPTSELEFTPRPKSKPKLKPSVITGTDFTSSLKGYQTNNFISYLASLFGPEITTRLIGKYFIGTSGHWPGATVFWQINANGEIRAGKVMLYNPENGKRVKAPFNHITWVHSALKIPDYNLDQCLFGEHLLKQNPELPVAVVESEKTAIIASIYLPQFIWLASGSLSNLSVERSRALGGRNVTLFPDLNGLEKWKEKAKALSTICRVSVSDLLENKATEEEREKGLDLADYLVRLNLADFTGSKGGEDTPVSKSEETQEQKISEQPTAGPFSDKPGISISEELPAPTLEVIHPQLKELQDFYANTVISEYPVNLNPWTIIISPQTFIRSHLAILESNSGKRFAKPYLDRLNQFKRIIDTNLQ